MQKDQRAQPVDRDIAGRSGAELIVEDFQRQRPGIIRRLHGLHEIDARQVALPREIAEMPAPGQDVHVEPGRVGDLNQENLVAGDRAHGLQVGLARKGVEGVEHQPDRLVVGAAHDFPGIAVIVDMAAPGKRLEADAHAALGGALAEFMEIGRGPVDAAERERRDIAAHQQHVGAELGHDVEFALGAVEGAFALRVRHALEIAERLQCDKLQAEVADALADIGRRAVEGQKIVLENLDALKARGRDRLQLLGEAATDRNGCDRGQHGLVLFFWLKRRRAWRPVP